MMGRPNLSRGTQVSGANGDRKKNPGQLTTGRMQPMIPLLINVLTSPLTGGFSEGLDVIPVDAQQAIWDAHVPT